MRNDKENCDRTTPILRLRATAPTELIRPRQKKKQPDGPWIAHPDLIDEGIDANRKKIVLAPDTTMKEYRDLWKEDHEVAVETLKDTKIEDFHLCYVIDLYPAIPMQKVLGRTDHEIASVIERQYVGAHQYLSPDSFFPPNLIDRFGADWRDNARGIYYRHYFSPAWVTADHKLWVPSLDGLDWNDGSEESRRTRARSFLTHALDNEKWNKSEYAWEADAWTDVFGSMRNDPALSVDKHEYNTIGQKADPVTCLLTGDSKYLKRIPDATFGLATFQPRDYQNAVAEWGLDRDRLEALLLHRHCSLISDPRWGDSSLAFPFGVYEAKGWSGDPREARRQACSAGKVYLDLLDQLAREPGKGQEVNGRYQTDQSHNSQVFVYTSFGAQWHILVGYKRPRLEREHAGHQGISESVYVFQRIWSSRVTTERRAWELLSLIDQIHLWGVTDFRDFVVQHLRPWHDFAKKCYLNDVSFLEHMPEAERTVVQNGVKLVLPIECVPLPEWTKHFTDDARLRLRQRQAYHLNEAWVTYQGLRANGFLSIGACGIGQCVSFDGPKLNPGYPLASVEECIMHLREVHGADDAEIAEAAQAWESRDFLRWSRKVDGIRRSGKSRKRGLPGEVDEAKGSKRSRR